VAVLPDALVVTDLAGTGGSATLFRIERVQFSDASNFYGTARNDSFTGTGGDDRVFGFDGNDSVTALFGNHVADAGGGANRITTGAGSDTISAGAGRDAVNAGAGDDRITGGEGADRLTGGPGADVFVFGDIAVGGWDTITDFRASDGDRLLFDSGTFDALDHLVDAGAGVAAALVFGAGAAPLEPDDRLVYDTRTRALSYDPDGSGAAPGVRLAVLVGVTTLSPADLWIV